MKPSPKAKVPKKPKLPPSRPPDPEVITVRNVTQNNLKGIDLDLPLYKLNVITGPSGSGKSSLAFQTIYAEGQRRYVETFSPYTRQFFDRMDKPQAGEIRGIPPAIAIAQSNTVRTSRSTVGTMTEINDYLKLWFPRIATGTCPSCHQPVSPDTPASTADAVYSAFPGKTILVTLPVPAPPATTAADFFPFLQSQGYLRVLLFGETLRTDEPASYKKKHLPAVVAVIQDRVRLTPDNKSRFLEALETAFHLGKGKLTLVEPESGGALAFSRGWHCAACDLELREPSPALFTFNNPIGACPACRGFGRTIGIDLERALPDKSLSIRGGLVKAFSGAVYADSQRDLEKASKLRSVPLTTPFDDLDPADQEWVLEGETGHRSDPEAAFESGEWYGVRGFFDYLESKSYKMHVRVFLSRFRTYTTCRTCQGARLQPEALAFRVNGHTLPELWQWPVTTLTDFIAGIPLPPGDSSADQLHREILSRLRYLENVGLGYLNLDRTTRSLSGGEVMRVTLTTCLGASLVNTLFVLDEPSIGLHPRDTGRLIDVMLQLRDKGNTLLVVEHEESVMRAADNLIEIGPGRGEQGGELVFHGPHSELPSARRSLTADYLLGRKTIPVPQTRRKPVPAHALQIERATQNNLQRLDVTIPLGLFCAVTGVSGSGKSTLVHEVLFENLLRKKGLSSENEPGRCRSLTGDHLISRVVMVDQSPPSRTPRSTPAVYTGAWDHIRAVFAATPDAEAQELGPGYFSFNSGTGRCGRCQGAGYEKVEMQFLSDLYVKCPECEGKRFRPEALDILHHGKSIHDVLEMTVTEAIPFLLQETELKANKAAVALKILAEVGLGYLRLGQPLNTLSGGESQRLKLVGHLLESTTPDPTLFILDEPTTGLHFDDINLLLQTFQRLVNQGHSLLVIEHNLEVIKCADWVIDLGPEAGSAGGRLLAEGPPERIAKVKTSHTATFLAEALKTGRTGVSPVPAGVPPGAGESAVLKTPTISYLNSTTPHPLLTAAETHPSCLSHRSPNQITITGAREHNLKNISLTIPRDQFVVVTGLSGSGKSTLAFDIIFAEGQRRFLDSMSTYARQFVDQMEKPEVDRISGLPPTVAIEQRITRGGGKSTVATVTEIYHFLRLLYAKLGQQHCPDCRIPVTQQSPAAIASAILTNLKKGPLRLMAPLIRGRKGFHTAVAAAAARAGCQEMRVDGAIILTENFTKLERFKEHTIDGVVAHLEKKPSLAELDSLVRRALDLGRGVIRLLAKNGDPTILNTNRSCPSCARSFDNLDPRLFSFNSPHGACSACRGYGTIPKKPRELDTLHANSVLEAELIEEQRRGTAEDAGESLPCPVCHGARLNEEARHVFVHGLDLGTLTAQPVSSAQQSLTSFQFTGTQEIIARDILAEVSQRLTFLTEVGLGYLQLNRAATTLSGGESQRIRLSSQLGSNLRGVLYVLDEPTIGLHPRDNVKLLDTLIALRDKGNSLLVVEHDEDTMRRSDLIIDLGPGAGQFGGEITAQGTYTEIQNNPDSVTGQALRHPMPHPSRGTRRPLPPADAKEAWLKVTGARANNLKSIDAAIPLARLTVLSGISGSGKSSLMRGVIHPAVHEALSATRHKKNPDLPCDKVEGSSHIEAVYEVDQSPIGKTSRSTPATYIKVFDEIRALFAALPTAKMRGYTASRFSFNTEGGRCEACGGNGLIKHEMAFLPTSHVVCTECKGLRYNASTLEIDYHGKTIGDIMNLTIAEAADFFTAHPKIARTLRLLVDTGTGYLKLGQPSPTLSGGEAQRLKLVAELSRGIARTANERLRKNRQPKGNLYLIEEPTIGLHPADVAKLIDVLHRLVDDGHTVIVIEHNLDVIAEADHVLDIGPEAGHGGGKIVATGTPEQIAKNKTSRTAPFLAQVLKQAPGAAGKRPAAKTGPNPGGKGKLN